MINFIMSALPVLTHGKSVEVQRNGLVYAPDLKIKKLHHVQRSISGMQFLTE
jgi:hypothetical protein